jgi:hypothetical protein
VGAALNRLCNWLQGAKRTVCTPPVEDCARWDTITETICDAMQTVTQTVCDAMQTVTQTVCDATKTVTDTVCDAFKSIPLIGNLVCFVSHVVSTVVCTASHVVSTTVCAASHVVSNVVCAAAHIVSKALCVLWTVVKAAACVVVGGAADLACKITDAVLGPGPILRSATQKAESVPRLTGAARSFALATNFDTVDLRAPYDEEGVHVAFRLVDGRAEWAVGAGAPYEPLVPVPSQLPAFASPRPDGGPLAVSYDQMRLGDWGEPPRLDMIAAGGDRVIAKKEGTDELYVCVICRPYLHRVGGRRFPLPQSYFKLDPELGLQTARIADLVAHVSIPGDDERHPATERFPLFRALFNFGAVRITLPPMLGQVLRTNQVDIRLFKGAGDLGLMQEMDTLFPPRVWQKVDLRPPRGGNEPPERYRRYQYEHVVYAANDEPGAQELKQHSIGYTRVLDLGVGLSHLHEQHDNRFGGELDNLTDQQWKLFGIFPIGGSTMSPLLPAKVSDDEAYQFANGPVQDFGGWVDGTCIYYLLVQLRAVDDSDPSTLRDAFAILWTDEQTAFTERWRALDLDDNAFKSPFKPMIAVLPTDAKRFYKDAPFDASRFWSPFREGHITPASRMAVTRQIVLVTGRDPATGESELYSIHFAWPTMDRTWRWRRLPDAAPADLRLREDSTIVVRGTASTDEKAVPGWWFQRYLPADGQETPSIPDRDDDAPSTKPGKRYEHPWGFVSDDVFPTIDQRFSHFGVYEPVRSRIQFYDVELDLNDVDEASVESAVWEDARHALRRFHRRLDWAAAAGVLDGGDPRKAFTFRTHPSIYNDPMAFKVVRRPGLGWILMHFDKRDDKLLSFDDVGKRALEGVVLSDRDRPERTIAVTVQRHLRNDVRALHGRTVGDEVDAVSPPQVRKATVFASRSGRDVSAATISFELARGPGASNAYDDDFDRWVAMNVWRVKIGAIVPRKRDGTSGAGVTHDVLLLFDRERATAFTADSPTTFSCTWIPSAADQRDGLLADLLTPRGRVHSGTSVWFVGATGLACCADETVFQI